MTGRFASAVASAVTVALSLALWTTPAHAHKTVARRYTFHADVAPVLRARCGACHAGSGPAVPLLEYAQAKAAAWRIEQELLSGRMPPWNADALSTPLKGAQTLTANEFNILMTWAASGAPQGPAAARTVPSRATSPLRWALGPPALVLSVPSPPSFGPGQTADDRDVVWPLDKQAGRWIRAVDLRVGQPSIMRRATIALRTKGNSDEQILGLWLPGDAPQTLPGGGAFEIPRGASLALHVHDERPSRSGVVAPAAPGGPNGDVIETSSGRSDVGVYFAPEAAAPHQVEVIELRGDGDWPIETSRVFTQPIDTASRLVALRPIGGPTDAIVRTVVVGPDGSRMALARLQLRPEWLRRYVFVTPVPILGGSRFEATVTASYGLSWTTLTGDRVVGPTEGGPFRMALEVIR